MCRQLDGRGGWLSWLSLLGEVVVDATEAAAEGAVLDAFLVSHSAFASSVISLL